MNRILIIEDDHNLNKGLSIALGISYEVISVKTMEEAKENLSKADLVLLDMNLPDGDGLDFIGYVRQQLSVPIIVLSAVNLESYIISAIELGADDYITKPFSVGILQAKIKRVFDKRNVQDNHIYRNDTFYFDFQKNVFQVKGVPVDFTPTESRILYYLIQNKKQVVTKEQLLDYVWGIDHTFIDANTLSVNISRIRTKLTPHQGIETIFGVGYKWVFS